jgi:ADP-ribosyl-[dinitrogen reductase] hydrolase
VDFRRPESILQEYPDGVRELADGGAWNTIAGQPTDDSEMALLLARLLADQGRYDPEAARQAHMYWLDSEPFDCGGTIFSVLRGHPNFDGQANGALMRISPLGILGVNHDLSQVGEWARQDAALTHPHPICQQANSLFATTLAHVIRTGCGPGTLYQQVMSWAEEGDVDVSLLDALSDAAIAPPADYVH